MFALKAPVSTRGASLVANAKVVKKAAAPKRSAPSGACLFAWENSRRARPDPEGSKESAVARRGPTRAPP